MFFWEIARLNVNEQENSNFHNFDPEGQNNPFTFLNLKHLYVRYILAFFASSADDQCASDITDPKGQRSRYYLWHQTIWKKNQVISTLKS